MEGILFGTAMIWVLTAAAILPLTNLSVKRRMAAESIHVSSLEDLPLDQQQRWNGITTGYYILWDVVVLGIAGLIAGLLGYFFIGISFNAKGWPGLIAFIGASLFGTAIK